MNEPSCHNMYSLNQEYESWLGRKKTPLTWFPVILLSLFAVTMELAATAPRLADLRSYLFIKSCLGYKNLPELLRCVFWEKNWLFLLKGLCSVCF